MEGKDSAPVANPMANLDSRLLGAEHFKSPKLKELLKESAPFSLGVAQALVQGHLVSGNMTHKLGDDTSVLPAWRKAYAHVITYNVPGKASADSLRKLAPESGAYANEVGGTAGAMRVHADGTRRLRCKEIGRMRSGEPTMPSCPRSRPSMIQRVFSGCHRASMPICMRRRREECVSARRRIRAARRRRATTPTVGVS